jgi:hypothetical protein
MMRLVAASCAVFAAALLILADTLGRVETPTVGSIYIGTAMAAPILLLAPELRP